MAKKRKLEASPSADRSELLRLLDVAKADHWDDGPRLALADWLEENGGEADRARAEVIRLQLDTDAGGPDWALSVERLREKHVRGWVPTCRRLFRHKLPSCERGLLVAGVAARMWREEDGAPDEAWAWVETARPASLQMSDMRPMMESRRMATVPRLDLAQDWLGMPVIRLALDSMPRGVRALRLSAYADGLALLARSLRAGLEELDIGVNLAAPPPWAPLLRSEGVVGLRGLTLRNSQLDDGGAALLAGQAGMGGLRRLELAKARLTAAGIESLAGLPLRRLKIHGGRFGLEALERLAAGACGASLEELTLAGFAGGGALPGPVRMPGLRRLTLSGCSLDAAAVAGLARSGLLAGLNELNLEWNPFGTDGVAALAASGVEGPRSLRLWSCGLGDAGAERLAAWPGLARVRSLDVGDNAIGTAGLLALAASPHLRCLEALNLRNNRTSRPALAALLRSPAAARLTWLSHEGIPPEQGLAEDLADARPPTLRELHLGGAAIDAAGMEGMARIRAALPECAIG